MRGDRRASRFKRTRGRRHRTLLSPERSRTLPAMSAFPVSPEKETQLTRRMAAMGVSEADLDETFVRSGGHGGQNVNKTSTCVMLLHRPTGLQVKCQATRQQGLNRFIARRLLLDKLEALRTGSVASERARIEKIRRQKRRRSRRAKQRMLADKAHHAAKKESRRWDVSE
jgi:peptide chain release factor